MIRFLITFLVCVGLGVVLITAPPVKHAFSEPFGTVLASISDTVISLWDGGIIRNGNVLRDAQSTFAVSVDAECNGIDAVLVLWAAIVAFPARLRDKLWGIALGFVAVQALNLVRIVSLYTVGQWDKSAFIWMHHNLWQGLMILGVLMTFLLWLRLSRHRERAIGGRDAGAA